jgi:hypothetical protein
MHSTPVLYALKTAENNMPFHFYHIIELTAALTGLALVRRSWPAPFTALLLLTILTVPVEITGAVMWPCFRLYNTWLYNLFSPVENLFVLYCFYRLLSNAKFKKLVLFLMPGTVLATVITYLFHNSFFTYNHHAKIIYLIAWVLAGSLSYVDIALKDDAVAVGKKPLVWLASGILFYSVLFILRMISYKMYISYPSLKNLQPYLNNISIGFMYLGCTAAFICQYREMK